MDLKEIKRITIFARKNGVKRLAIDGLEIEFSEVSPTAIKRAKKLAVADDGKPAIEPPRPATLQEINDWIYKESDGVA